MTSGATPRRKSRFGVELGQCGNGELLDQLVHARFIRGYDGYDRYDNANGVEVLIAARHLAATDWYLTISLPTEEAFAPVRAMNQRHLLSAAFLTLLAGLVTWWLLRRQLAPLFATVRPHPP